MENCGTLRVTHRLLISLHGWLLLLHVALYEFGLLRWGGNFLPLFSRFIDFLSVDLQGQRLLQVLLDEVARLV